MPIRLCLEAKCREQARYRGRCSAHARDRERVTHLNRAFYNSKRWQITRRKVLFDQPLCECGQIASDVDHIRPIEAGGNPWARWNLQGLCKSCHGRKTRMEQVGG